MSFGEFETIQTFGYHSYLKYGTGYGKKVNYKVVERP